MNRVRLHADPEPLVSCKNCCHAHPVPDGEAGAERNVYCRRHTLEEHPHGLKIRRTSFCDAFESDKNAVEAAGRELIYEVLGREIAADDAVNGKGAVSELREIFSSKAGD